MKPPIDDIHKKAYFAVYYDKNGDAVHVEGPNGEVEGVFMADSPVNNLKRIDVTLVGHKPGHSPCCVIINNKEYCWC
ncbi:MAG: hypothetical protein HKM93_22015 [Desulfobacteraceae bacterium]|nr:hypothetical protein [Desulfobacteraceae bacterium]